jgi:hypothetical protein
MADGRPSPKAGNVLRMLGAVVASVVLSILFLFKQFVPGIRIAVRLIPFSEPRKVISGSRIFTAILINGVCWFVVICGAYVLGTGLWREEVQRRLRNKLNAKL